MRPPELKPGDVILAEFPGGKTRRYKVRGPGRSGKTILARETASSEQFTTFWKTVDDLPPNHRRL